jgi:hypothetical protein
MKLADLESIISRREKVMASMGLVPNRSFEGVLSGTEPLSGAE